MTALERPVVLAGQKVVLRDLKSGDVTQAYVDWMNDPEVMRYTESRFSRYDLQGIRDYVSALECSPHTVLLGIFTPEENLHVGNIKLGPIHWHHGLGDLGLIIGRKEYWGKGLATEAIALASGYAFARLGLHKVTAGCYASNQGSAKAFLKAGFRQEAVRPQHVRGDSGWEDVLELAMIRTEEDERTQKG